MHIAAQPEFQTFLASAAKYSVIKQNQPKFIKRETRINLSTHVILLNFENGEVRLKYLKIIRIPTQSKIEFKGSLFLNRLQDFSLLSSNSFLHLFLKSKFTKKNPCHEKNFIFEGQFSITIIYFSKVIHTAHGKQMAQFFSKM